MGRRDRRTVFQRSGRPPIGRNEVAYGMPAKSAAERFDYVYTSTELQGLAQRYSPIARSVRYPHAVFNNCMEDKSQLNAREFLEAPSRG